MTTTAGQLAPPLHDSMAHDSMSIDLERAFDRETRIGVLIALGARGVFVAYGVIDFVLNQIPLRSHMPAWYQYPIGIMIFALAFNLFSIAFFVIALRSKTPVYWCFASMFLDFLILSELKFFWFWSPAVMLLVPRFIVVRNLDVIVFFLIVSIYTLPMYRTLIAWAGTVAAAVWAGGICYTFLMFPPAKLFWGTFDNSPQALAAVMKPDILIGDLAVLQVLSLVLFALFLAIGVQEGRRFVVARVRAETDRAVLTRFFPPEVVSRIVDTTNTSLAASRRSTAILFVGIPRGESVIVDDFARLESYYTIVEQSVFAHSGILDRFDGSPVMASFGALEEDTRAARRAYECALDLARRFSDENLSISMGLHAGVCVCGEAGGARNRIFSVIGDSVNASRRILDEAEAREISVALSDALLQSADLSAAERIHLDDLGVVAIRGRDMGLRLWSVRR